MNFKLSLAGFTSAAALLLATPVLAQEVGAPYAGEVQLFGSTSCPAGTLEADGAMVSPNAYPALNALFGTTFGGNGVTSIGLPDLRGRAVMHVGVGGGRLPYSLGQRGGTELTRVSIAQMPAHSHDSVMLATDNPANIPDPAGAVLADHPDLRLVYSTNAPDTGLVPGSVVVLPGGGGQPFTNVNPFTTMRQCISTSGNS